MRGSTGEEEGDRRTRKERKQRKNFKKKRERREKGKRKEKIEMGKGNRENRMRGDESEYEIKNREKIEKRNDIEKGAILMKT